MKSSRYIILIAFAAAISGCAKENSDTNLQDKPISIEAYSPAFETSKTVLGDGGAVLWDGQESINVFCGSASSKFTSGETLSKSAIATFSGSIDATSGPLYAIYPYSYGNELYGELTTLPNSSPYVYYILTIPELQTATEGSFDKNAFPAVASGAFGEPLHFKNVCGGFCFTLSSDKVTKVVFRGNDNERLAGKIIVQSYKEELEITDSMEHINRITLSPLSGTLKPGVKYYISIWPTKFSKGFTVELWTAEGIHYDYVDTTNRTLGRSTFGRVGNIDRESGVIVPVEMISDNDYKFIVDYLGLDASSISWNWSVSDESIATVLSSDKNICTIRYIKQGDVILTARSLDGKYCASRQIALITAVPSNVSYDSATISGQLGTFTKSATLYYSSTASSVNALKSNGTKKTISLNDDGTYSISVDDLSQQTKYYYCVVAKVDDVEFVSSVCDFTTVAVPELIDMGLSVKWRSWNLGASKPEEYGGYYQWAGTSDVTDSSNYLDSSNCPYHTGSSTTSGWTKYIPLAFSSYGNSDNKFILEPKDDVAHVKLSGNWRIPTQSEWDELENKCTWRWETLNGIKGYRVTSTKNGNSIFLPAAGNRIDARLVDVGYDGNYWSSELWVGEPRHAYFMSFSSNYVSGSSHQHRYIGSSIRPVSE